MEALVFIDTNIFLDFYRVRDAGLSLLAHINSNHDRIITTSQVEMEYKKNRQCEVLRVLRDFKNPDWNSLNPPAFLSRSRANRAIVSRRKQIEGQSKRLKKTIEGVLKRPSSYDPVFRAAVRLFRHQSPLNLDRANGLRYKIRRLAWKRFILGYPPRKPGDTATGDAINWEWIIHCACEARKSVVIVSRDSDYGVRFNDTMVLNDWLSQEFRERVSRRRKVILTDRLAEAFRQAAAPVTKKQAEEEEDLIKRIQDFPPAAGDSQQSQWKSFGEYLERHQEKELWSWLRATTAPFKE